MEIEKYQANNGKIKWKFSRCLGFDALTGEPNEITYSGFHTENEARDKLLQLLQEDGFKKFTPNQKICFDEVANRWLSFYKKQVKVTTYTNRKNLIQNHIFPHFKNYPIDQINIFMCQQAIEDWYSYFSEAQRLADLVSTIFRFAINQGLCTENPMAKTIRPRNTHKTEYQAPFYEKDQLQKFLHVVKTDESLRAYTMFHTLAFTGLRRGELFAIQWQDIDFDTKVLAIERNLIYNEELKQFELSTPKTQKSIRKIGLDETTLSILWEWRLYQQDYFAKAGTHVDKPDQLVFTTSNNHYLSDSYLRRIIKRVTKKHNLPHITVHGFRHTHCSLLFEAGVEMHNVKNRLGHRDIQTTMNIYQHVTQSARDETAELFGSFMEMDEPPLEDFI